MLHAFLGTSSTAGIGTAVLAMSSPVVASSVLEDAMTIDEPCSNAHVATLSKIDVDCGQGRCMM